MVVVVAFCSENTTHVCQRCRIRCCYSYLLFCVPRHPLPRTRGLPLRYGEGFLKRRRGKRRKRSMKLVKSCSPKSSRRHHRNTLLRRPLLLRRTSSRSFPNSITGRFSLHHGTCYTVPLVCKIDNLFPILLLRDTKF